MPRSPSPALVLVDDRQARDSALHAARISARRRGLPTAIAGVLVFGGSLVPFALTLLSR